MGIRIILSVFFRTVQLFAHLFWIWATLGWKVRKARRAFERELTRHGVSKKDAKRLSKQINIAKNQVISALWKFAS